MPDQPNGAQLDTVRVRVLPDGRVPRRDAAAYLGVKETTMANWAVLGKGPPVYRVGNRAFYQLDDLKAEVQAA